MARDRNGSCSVQTASRPNALPKLRAAPFWYEMNIEQARFNMIEHRALAFADIELPFRPTPGRCPGRCMLAPGVEARMLQDLALRPTDSVLEIGTGSGFMASLLASRQARS